MFAVRRQHKAVIDDARLLIHSKTWQIHFSIDQMKQAGEIGDRVRFEIAWNKGDQLQQFSIFIDSEKERKIGSSYFEDDDELIGLFFEERVRALIA